MNGKLGRHPRSDSFYDYQTLKPKVKSKSLVERCIGLSMFSAREVERCLDTVISEIGCGTRERK